MSPPMRVPLCHLGRRPALARLREPRGEDELSLEGVDTFCAVRLLDRLLEPDTLGEGLGAADLSASDRDALLAGLHRSLWGDRIVGTLHCAGCGQPYDMSFELSALQRHLAPQPAPGPAGLRGLQLDSETLTLPSAQEELAAAERGPAAGAPALAQGVAGRELRPEETDTLAAELEAQAPLLDVELDAPCSECGQAQQAHFDVQSYTLQRLLDEREAVLGELHVLARAYGWGLGELLGLRRSLRRSLVAMARE